MVRQIFYINFGNTELEIVLKEVYLTVIYQFTHLPQ